MRYRTAVMALIACLVITVAFISQTCAAPQAKIANLKFSGTLSEADQNYLGLEKPGAFTLKDIKAQYVLIEITRTT
jgi:hypothetical protein